MNRSSAVTESFEDACYCSKRNNSDGFLDSQQASVSGSQQASVQGEKRGMEVQDKLTPLLSGKDHSPRCKSPETYCISKDQGQGNIAWTTSLMLKEIHEDVFDDVPYPYVAIAQGMDSETNSICFFMNIEGLQRDGSLPPPMSPQAAEKTQSCWMGGIVPVQKFYLQECCCNAADSSPSHAMAKPTATGTGGELPTCREEGKLQGRQNETCSSDLQPDAKPQHASGASTIWKKLKRIARRGSKSSQKSKPGPARSSWIPRCLNGSCSMADPGEEYDDVRSCSRVSFDLTLSFLARAHLCGPIQRTPPTRSGNRRPHWRTQARRPPPVNFPASPRATRIRARRSRIRRQWTAESVSPFRQEPNLVTVSALNDVLVVGV
eukprot:766154-Hanusia_phi.AAC.3